MIELPKDGKIRMILSPGRSDGLLLIHCPLQAPSHSHDAL